jgi:alkylation response protein AidB-like acyl-CoA dehydrogenase
MNFALTDEQQMLVDSARQYIDRSYTFEDRKRRLKQGGFARATWQSFGEMGWLAASIPESHAGLGFSAVETALIAEQIGRGLVLEPYTLCGVFPAAVVNHCGDHDQKAAVLPAIGSGNVFMAVAYGEQEARGCVAHVRASAAQQANGSYLLNGRKTVVVGAPVAERLLVVARTDGSTRDETGISVFLLDRESAGLTLEPYQLVDGTPAADILMKNVVASHSARIGPEGTAHRSLQLAVDESIVSLCAETVGGMQDVLALCAEYLKTRKQFGVPIGSFQALQHRMADMAIEMSQARATLHRALAALANVESPDRSVVISGCKAQITRSAKFVTAQGIQLHGGYGITEEYRVGHHYRRLLLTDASFGNLEHHLNRYAHHIQAQARAMAAGQMARSA